MRAISSLLSTALVVSFGISGVRAAPAPVNLLEFERVTSEKTAGDCLIGTDECAYVRLGYPVVVAAPEGYAVTFYCNLYEVAPYAFGPTQIVLTWDELDGLLRERAGDTVEAGTGRSDAPWSRGKTSSQGEAGA